ncbi:MAG: DUF4256 domain-containing protein [Bergeyella sp.]
MKKQLSPTDTENLLKTLKDRFEKNMNFHPEIQWEKVEKKLKENPEKIWSLNEMERTGGEPDVVIFDEKSDEIVFADCAPESPKERRSLCYDRAALEARKQHKPESSAMDATAEMGIEMLNENQYRKLQELGKFDQKTSSWILTPEEIRKLGGALFCDRRYNTVFTYHNGAESYYAARGFRGFLKV